MEKKKNNGDYEYRRQYRKQRRVRSQITAVIIMLVMLVIVVVAGYLGVTNVVRLFKEKQEADRIAIEEAAEEANAEMASVETPSEEVSEEASLQTEDEMLLDIVNTCISEMSIEDKIAGLFIVTPEQLTGTENVVKAGSATQESLAAKAVGGIIYNASNIKSAEQVTEMLSSISTMSKYPIFTVVSEDGSANGNISSALSLDTSSSPRTLGQNGDADEISNKGVEIASMLGMYGFNFNLAPVCNFIDSDSAFGTDVNSSAGNVASFVSGMEETGVTACLKYFPVYGNTSEGAATSEITLDDFNNGEKLVFKTGIDAGAGAVMLSNISASGITGDGTPCSLSSVVITDILRNDMGFNGVIVTGNMTDKAITDSYGADQAAIMAITAGADMILDPQDYDSAYNALLTAVNDGTLSESRIDESLQRILKIKYKSRVDEIANESNAEL
ncbi:MAG: beta-N-acetylhexosaminidase, partial [Butyrivibrio sp.]|nr:beta-N-acetylhexosaminidase [Butyrivibrio sp.]